jgi:hypothetical protein
MPEIGTGREKSRPILKEREKSRPKVLKALPSQFLLSLLNARDFYRPREEQAYNH